jgi:hypothetical protein
LKISKYLCMSDLNAGTGIEPVRRFNSLEGIEFPLEKGILPRQVCDLNFKIGPFALVRLLLEMLCEIKTIVQRHVGDYHVGLAWIQALPVAQGLCWLKC